MLVQFVNTIPFLYQTTFRLVQIQSIKSADKILALFKLRAFADDKINVTQNIKRVFHMIENIVRKGENAGYDKILSLSKLKTLAYNK